MAAMRSRFGFGEESHNNCYDLNVDTDSSTEELAIYLDGTPIIQMHNIVLERKTI